MLSKIKKLIYNPDYSSYIINRVINSGYHTRLGKRRYNINGVDIFQEDWDNLIILDACRYDSLERRSKNIPGRLESRESRGSASVEWVRGNFDQQLHDVVYLTTNLFFTQLYEDGDISGEVYAFHSVQKEIGLENHGEFGMTPEKTTTVTKQLYQEYPNKRFIVHLMQPHAPYIGEFGREYFNPDDPITTIFRSDRPEITPAVVRKAYQENLDIVLESVDELLSIFRGKTVVSSDHGELLGERVRPLPVVDWGHPAGVYVEELTKVPWLIVNDNERKTIIPEEPRNESSSGLTPSQVEQQLSALGYR